MPFVQESYVQHFDSSILIPFPKQKKKKKNQIIFTNAFQDV